MSFTALHRVLGRGPGPLTDELLDSAVAAGATESDDLDWKSELPPQKGLPQTDFPKDVAAMANSGGGVIVFGVHESQKAATGRTDVGDFDEGYERSLRSAAITAITPPVFGLNVFRLGSAEGERAVIVEVPASVDGPHLIYRGDYFGAPVRNDADTVWMKERQIEAMYRARFDERRHATEVLDTLYAEAAAGRDSETRAWLVAVAHPRLPRVGSRLTRDEAREILAKAESLALFYAGRGGIDEDGAGPVRRSSRGGRLLGRRSGERRELDGDPDFGDGDCQDAHRPRGPAEGVPADSHGVCHLQPPPPEIGNALRRHPAQLPLPGAAVSSDDDQRLYDPDVSQPGA